MYLPPPEIKAGFSEIFVRALDREGQAFAYLRNTFPKLSEVTAKAGIFIGPQL